MNIKPKAPKDRVLWPINKMTSLKMYKKHARFHETPMRRLDPKIKIPRGEIYEGGPLLIFSRHLNTSLR